jgi:hypothetical protein
MSFANIREMSGGRLGSHMCIGFLDFFFEKLGAMYIL